MKKKLALIMAIMLVIALFTGCGGNSGGSNGDPNTGDSPGINASPETTPLTEISPTPEPPQDFLAAGKYEVDAEGWPLGKFEYELPLTTKDITFSLMTVNYTPQYIPEGDLNEIPIWGQMGDMTGVHIEYILATAADCAEKFATMLAADDLPDICSQGQNRYTGSQREAIDDGWFVNIADYREYIPNYLYEIHERSRNDSNVYEQVFLDDDTACVFYNIWKISSGIGWFIREDLMEDLGLGKAADIITVDQLHDVFLAFKAAYGDQGFSPMILYYCFELDGGKLLSCYNTALFTFSIGYYKRLRDGHVEYCGATDDDLAALTTLNGWWNEGLIDPDWSSYSGNMDLDAQFTNGTMGYVFLTPDDAMKRNAVCIDPDCRYMPTPRLRLTEDQVLKWGLAEKPLGSGSYVVSTKCADIPLCLTWIDWQYSEAGSEYISWGPEGDLWAYDSNGKRMLTDFILNNEAGSTWIMQLYGANTMSDGGLIDNSRNYAVAEGETLLDMNGVWDVGSYYNGKYDCPNSIQLKGAQTGEVNNLGGDTNSDHAEN